MLEGLRADGITARTRAADSEGDGAQSRDSATLVQGTTIHASGQVRSVLAPHRGPINRAKPTARRPSTTPKTIPKIMARVPPIAIAPKAPPTTGGTRQTTTRVRRDLPAGSPPAQALPRPPPLPTTSTTRAADDLTRHRSIIREAWPMRSSSLLIRGMFAAHLPSR